MASPRLSVLICSYNHAPFVGAAIRSVLAQNFTDFELIVADDASTDGSQQVIRQFSDSRMRVILRENNLGICGNFNATMREAKGEFIALVGSDDMFLPDKLAEQIAVFDANPNAGAVFTHIEIIGKRGTPYRWHPLKHFKHFFNRPNRPRQEWLRTLFHHNCLAAPSAMVRRSAIERVGMYDERLSSYHDYDLWLRLGLAGYDLHMIPKTLTLYRRLIAKKSLSAKSVPVHNRGRFEQRHLLKNFLSIQQAATAREIFPEIPADAEDALVPYYIARQALNVGTRTHREFALETLYELLGNPALAERLHAAHGFTLRDYHRLTTDNALGFPRHFMEWAGNSFLVPPALMMHDWLCGFIYKPGKEGRTSSCMRWIA